MELGRDIAVMELRALNRCLKGARITRVMTGLDGGKWRFVIVTDRAHADTGLVMILVLTEPLRCELIAGSYEELSGPEG